jgi:hypothetical protein
MHFFIVDNLDYNKIMKYFGVRVAFFSIVTRLQTQSGIQIPVGARDFLISKMSRLALGPTQPSIQWVLEFFLGCEVNL